MIFKKYIRKLGLNDIKNLLIDYTESQRRIKKIRNEFNYETLRKVRISVSANTFSTAIKLQSPGQLGVWGKTAFVTCITPDINLVINKPNRYLKLSSDIENNWLLHIEPPGYIRKLFLDAPKIMRRFGRIYTSAPHLYEQGGKFIPSPPYVHWHLALSSYSRNPQNLIYDYDFLTSCSHPPDKTVVLTTINSGISDLPGHKLRADFIQRIGKSDLNFDLYGASNWGALKQYRGRADSKWPIYSKSKYVLAIENEVSEFYWTEKFTDAILCHSMPIYYGSPKISNYFPEGSYIPIDITRKSAVDDLRDILSSDFYEKNIPRLLEARNSILKKHNMLSFIDSELNGKS